MQPLSDLQQVCNILRVCGVLNCLTKACAVIAFMCGELLARCARGMILKTGTSTTERDVCDMSCTPKGPIIRFVALRLLHAPYFCALLFIMFGFNPAFSQISADEPSAPVAKTGFEGGSRVQIARSSISYNSAKARLIAELFAANFDSILSSSRYIDLVNSQGVIDAMSYNGYRDDAALVAFAEKADIPILVTGSVDDSGKRCILRLYALCYEAPYYGQRVAQYRAHVSFGKNGEAGSSIVEEHTARFLAKLFSQYRRYLPLDALPDGFLRDGEYPLYGAKGDKTPSAVFRVEHGRVKTFSKGYHLQTYGEEAGFLNEFYYGRKKEIVLPPASTDQALYTAVATPLVSLVAPLASPLSYYTVSDFSGLGLWAVNNTPWMYIALDGFFRSPESYEKEGRQVSRYRNAAHGFMWYYFLSAGSAMYADSISYYSMRQASNFDQLLPWTGNDHSAIALALLGSGGGFFYKGQRAWGYLYFHADAALLFASLYCLLPQKVVSDSQNERYRARGYALAGAAVAVRIFEFFHCMNTPYAITNGYQIEGNYALAPVTGWDGSLFAGMSVSLYF